LLDQLVGQLVGDVVELAVTDLLIFSLREEFQISVQSVIDYIPNQLLVAMLQIAYFSIRLFWQAAFH
jgi:hypothetical protein